MFMGDVGRTPIIKHWKTNHHVMIQTTVRKPYFAISFLMAQWTTLVTSQCYKNGLSPHLAHCNIHDVIPKRKGTRPLFSFLFGVIWTCSLMEGLVRLGTFTTINEMAHNKSWPHIMWQHITGGFIKENVAEVQYRSTEKLKEAVWNALKSVFLQYYVLC